MRVDELPSMTILSINREGPSITIRGRFDRLDGLRESGWFWPGPGRYLFADLEGLDRNTGELTVTVVEPSEAEGLSTGDRLPWFDAYWQVPVVDAIIDESHAWQPVTFEPSTAVHFSLGNSAGWQPLGQDLPDGAVISHEEEAGWDHEHCSICTKQINSESPQAYLTADGTWWLCESCYQRYGKTHDVSFQLGA